MTLVRLFVVTTLGVSLLACSELPSTIDAGFGSGSSSGAGGGGAAGSVSSTSTGAGAGASTQSGIPCEVAAVLASHCDSCHAVTTPPILATYDDFLMPSNADPSQNMAEISVARMLDAAAPMPPAAMPPSADVAVLEQWVSAGMPTGDCGEGGPVDNPFDTPPTCSSNTIWTNGDDGGGDMYPGRACNDCHADEGKKIFAFAGTVYPTAHEPDDCYGVGAAGAIVEVVDANGATFQVTTTDTGNFDREGAIAYPAYTRVIANGTTLDMIAPLTGPQDADCNSCHSQDGIEGAPGRIILPPN
jgi:hypothetical protein